MNNQKLLVIGLPNAGKTTFVGALWHVLDSGQVSGSLKIVSTHGDQEYLNRIRDAWAGCNIIERTMRGQGGLIAINLENPSTQNAIELTFPDPSGESFNDIWELGQCSQEYLTLATEAQGILLFVNPEFVNDSPSISQVIQAGTAGGADAPPTDDITKATLWTPKTAGTQVKLVEILQILLRPPFSRSRKPVAVIVSAWDVLQHLELTPPQWLQETMPLLHQFLTTNADLFPFKVYGISAQGGSLSERTRLLGVDNPWTRVQVKDDNTESHDISRPIRWLMTA